TRLAGRVRAVLGVEVGVRAVFEARTVAALARRLDEASAARPAVLPGPRPRTVPLSFGQRRLWYLHQLPGAATAYNMVVPLRLTGPLDVDALGAALADVAERHDVLRTAYPQEGGVPRQVLLPTGPRLEQVHLDEARLADALDRAAAHHFDLAAEPPLLARLHTTGPGRHVLLLVWHHIAGDGWSQAPFARDLARAYEARAGGRAPDWEPLPVTYADYTRWQHELPAASADHWRAVLAGLPDEVPLPADRPRPAVSSYRGGTVEFAVPARLRRKLDALAQRTGTTLFMVLHAGLAALLTRLGAGTDIPIGTPVAGRTDEALSDLVGCFLNTLVLRADTSGDPTFRALLGRVRDTDLAAYDHQDLPFERLVEIVNPPRSAARHPLCQVMLTLQNTAAVPWELPGVRVRPEPVRTHGAKLDLSFEFAEDDGGLAGTVVHSADTFDRATVTALVARLTRLLEQVAADPDRRLGDLDVLDDRERAAVAAPTARFAVTSLPAAFAPVAREHADRVAVVHGDLRLTYADLDARSDRLARWLVTRGVGPERLVALLLPRSADLVVAVLAVLKAGGTYVPVDPDQPAARTAAVLADAAPVVVLTPDDLDVPDVAAALPDVRADHAAYVIHTSGSTGRPKGVVVEHGSVVRLLAAAREGFDFTPDDVWTLFHSYAFDFSVWELWGPLLRGGSLVVVPHEVTRSPRDLADLVRRHGVTVLNQTPTAFRGFAAVAGDVPSLRHVVFGGEELRPPQLLDWLERHPDVRLVNMYGITETTVHVTHQALTPALCHGPSLIGVPLPDLRVYVLDEALRPAPTGVRGELYVSGPGLARGYLGQPGVTAARFVADPFRSGERMYRTGDVGRLRADGALEYLGRADDQVKVRGHRIEPGEVVAAVSRHPDVRDAAVVARDGRLLCYVVGPVDPADLRAHVARLLPGHMVPAAFTAVDRLPLTRNGKLDTAALPTPDLDRLTTPSAPRTDAERVLAAAFAQVLGLR
ncbi:MAG: amino acid adenylation domain-containing protein, partial [Saccharothrix sp.]|nr:amino acid adenylation domain-containing protein [Saccharothrix sp.]